MAAIDYGLKKPDNFFPIPDSILEETIITRFEAMVEKHPEHTAIESEGLQLSYRELNNAINHLAYRIIAEMREDKSPVAFLFQDEVLSIIALMAIPKAGRLFVGFHPSNSKEQLASYFEDSTASLLVTSSDLRPVAEAMIAGREHVRILYLDTSRTESTSPNPGIVLRGSDLHAIFYTSGTTGKPKGILLPHVYLAQWAQYISNDWFLSPSDRIAVVTSVCFLAAYTSLMGALLNGGTLCVLDLKKHSAQAVLDWIRDAKLTIFRCTPSIFRTVFGQATAGLVIRNLRFITLGGEPVTDKDIELFKSHTADDCILINNFASSEGGMLGHFVVSHRTPPFGDFLPAGYPAPGKEFLLLDEDGKEVEAGQEGEIVVRSRYLSLGYWRQPELTAQKFHEDPNNPGFRLYFSADRGRWLENGALEVTGRKDTQVKIRGYRVQLEAIDLALRGFPGVVDAATVVHRPAGAGGSGERLVAYICLAGQEQLSASQIRKHLAVQLPDYMIPSAFVQMDVLPRTATGKLSRRELPEPSNLRPGLGTPYVGPRNESERKIAAIWEQALQVDGIGVNDDFFELGGDSLLASEIFVAIEREFEKRYPMNVLLKQGTVAKLAEQMDTLGSEGPSTIVPLRVQGTLPPLFLVPGGGGDVISFMDLVDALGEEQPAYGFQDFNVQTQESIYVQGVEKTAEEFIRAMTTVRPIGPYHIVGHSLGGMIAFEMARQLRKAGEQVGLLGLLDSSPPRKKRPTGTLRNRYLAHALNMKGLSAREKVEYVAEHGKAFLGKRIGEQKALRKLYQAKWVKKILWRDPLRYAHGLMAEYYPTPYEGSGVIYRVTRRSLAVTWDVTAPWKQFILGGLEFYDVPGNHHSMIKNPNALKLAEVIKKNLQAVNEK
jgi:amino acid adenylation domain-containing protein